MGNKNITVEEVESGVPYLKESIFALAHFDSPQFIDLQDSFNAMELNYLRLKQRLFHEEDKVIEIAKDWHRYVEALMDLKDARIMLDVEHGDNVYENLRNRSKEPAMIKDEVEKKFKSLLKDDWEQIPPNYHERMKMMKEPNEKERKKYGIGQDWKHYYQDSYNFYKLIQERSKQKENTKE